MTPHYRYHWQVQLDAPSGRRIDQFQSDGSETSLSRDVPWDRVCRLSLLPTLAGLIPLDIVVDLPGGERAFYYWGCRIGDGDTAPAVRIICGLERNGQRLYVVHHETENRFVVTSAPDLAG